MQEDTRKPADDTERNERIAAIKSRNRAQRGLFVEHERIEVCGIAYKVSRWDAEGGKLFLKPDKAITTNNPVPLTPTVELRNKVFRVKTRDKGRLQLKEVRGNASVNSVPEELMVPKPAEPEKSLEDQLVELATEKVEEKRGESDVIRDNQPE